MRSLEDAISSPPGEVTVSTLSFIHRHGYRITLRTGLSVSAKEIYWPDNWTNVTVDGRFSAQFEHTLLVTKTGVEVLTARLESSPGGPIHSKFDR
ncbi:hypothetical protein AMS68_004536 [Peltaster fructicola]|uniref:Peptidase M24 domain-containing protein n=1 Tax=Peltaster fructicola TaxID=286661 RepID=A0A6H0XWM7_9PEZI|nr:hypothetical protein AMS68_004536 [Peltaster fructicola]